MLNCPILTRRYLTQPPTVLFKSNKDINMTNRLVSTALSVSQPQAQLVVSLSPQPVSGVVSLTHSGVFLQPSVITVPKY